MRKLSIFCAVSLALASIACNKTRELPDGGPAKFGISASGETWYPKLARNGSQKIYFTASTEDNGVKEQLTAHFKVGDSTLVAKYNETAPADRRGKIFPIDAYSFTTNDVTIDRYNRNSRIACLTVTNTATMAGDTVYVLPVLVESVTGSANASANTESVVYFAFFAQSLDKGKGTKDEPYLIYDADDLLKMSEMREMAADEYKDSASFAAAVPTYYKLVEDIDMSGVEWTPLNAGSPYAHKVDFNGNHKTIKNLTYTGSAYGGMFGVLVGEVYDLNLIDASITTNKDKSGLLCGYLGTGDVLSGKVHGCKVTGNLTVDNNSVGGIAGLMVGGEIYECLVDARITNLGDNRYYVGGIVGCGNGKPGKIHDCITMGEIESAGNLENKTFNRNVAGICGAFETSNYSIVNCISLAKIHCNAVGAGILGHANLNSWGAKTDVNDAVIGCIAWNESILIDNSRVTTQKQSRDDYAMGGGCIFGWGNPENILRNCWRKADINFKVTCPDDPGSEAHYKPFNQEDAGPGSPLSNPNGELDYKTFWEGMYHGKAAAAGETASQVAKRIGWNENVWDLSGEIPALKNVY